MVPLNLLLVEDDLAFLELMTAVLESMDARVCALSDSSQAAHAVTVEKFDGIFLDLEMPKLHGLELAKKIRISSRNSTTPIIVVTGSETNDAMKHSFLFGANFFLQKPVDRQKLATLFQSVRGTLIENRRKSARASINTELQCKSTSRSARGCTWNLSEGGMQIEVQDLRDGEEVELSFRFPGSRSDFTVNGTVVWTRGDRQGVRFTELSQSQRVVISSFIARVAED